MARSITIQRDEIGYAVNDERGFALARIQKAEREWRLSLYGLNESGTGTKYEFAPTLKEAKARALWIFAGQA